MVSFLGTTSDSAARRASKISAIFFDVDGVLTPGDVTYDSTGKEIKSFNVIDGHRIKLAQRFGISIYFMTGRTSDAVKKRADELGIDGLYQGVLRKGIFFQELLNELKSPPDQIAFLGDDLIDIPVLRKVGLAGAVANCSTELLAFCHVKTDKIGGYGAAGEFIEFILHSKNLWQDVLAFYQQDSKSWDEFFSH